MPNQKLAYDRFTYILVVDDDKTLLKFFKIHLNKFFSRVIVVKNVKEAMTALKEKEIDLVITDIRMPRIDGFQLITKVRKHDPSIPIFMISGALLTDEQKAMITEKADGFLRKPFSVEELENLILSGLKHRAIYSKLYEMVPDRKKIRKLIDGHTNMRELRENGNKERAIQLIEELKKVG